MKFIKADGETYELNHIFYPLQRNLYAATIQSVWEPNLRGILFNRTVRLTIWCTNDERAQYLLFRVSGQPATCDDIANLCTVRARLGAPPRRCAGPTTRKLAKKQQSVFERWRIPQGAD